MFVIYYLFRPEVTLKPSFTKGPSENRSDNAFKTSFKGEGVSHEFGIDVKKQNEKKRMKW